MRRETRISGCEPLRSTKPASARASGAMLCPIGCRQSVRSSRDQPMVKRATRHAIDEAALPMHLDHDASSNVIAFRELDESDLAALQRLATSSSYENGESVFRAGDADY